MTNKTLLTSAAKLYSVENLYYSPISVTPPYYVVPDSTYIFLSHVQPWDKDYDPPWPQQNQRSLKNIAKNMFFAKKITPNDISPIIQRIDWESGTTYDYYRDDLDIIGFDQNGYLIYNFYVRNRYDQVFKCLWNNNDSPSTLEPYFEPGTYSSNKIFAGSDGYKWKYIYTIESALKIKFMTTDWMPVIIGSNIPNSINTNAGAGDIEVINVTNGGSGYDTVNTDISVIITGDGTGCQATAKVVNGEIVDVDISNTGKNYTYANVAFVSSNTSIGSGATAICPPSPVGGHGFDPITELGCCHVMFAPEISGSENNFIPTDITYHQVGLLVNPASLQSISYDAPNANGDIYKTSTDIVVADGVSVYVNDDIVFQSTTGKLADATFTGTVLSFNKNSNILSIINTSGTLSIDSALLSSSGASRTVLSYTTPDLDTLSGYITYIENRSGIERSADGIEQFKIILGF